jgi:hypothetical protein
VAFPLVSLIACSTARLSTWRPEDYDAYKAVRVLSGRRIAGSAWLPVDGGVVRVSNAHGPALLGWFGDRAVRALDPYRNRHPRVVLLPIPGPNRVVGAPPSGSRALAQELSLRTGLRVLDVLRWRQPMPRCPPPDRQVCLDNVIVTGSPVRADAILVSDFLSTPVALEAVAARLRQMGCSVVLGITAGLAAQPSRREPFAQEVQMIGTEVLT